MPRSMTGFSRLEEQFDWGNLIVEIRSVNHRYLEPSFRLPEALRSAEPALRDVLRKNLQRGKIEINIQFKVIDSDENTLGLNLPLAKQLAALTKELNQEIDQPAPINSFDILRWPGVIQTAELDPDQLQKDCVALFGRTLKNLIENRQREGEELKNFIEQRLNDVSAYVKQVRVAYAEIMQAYRDKLRARLDAFDIEVDEERFTQEVVFIAQKADIAEELDRLDAHVNEIKHSLSQKGPIGRRLDFLMQELNREANTLSSKSMATETSKTAVDLKVLIEQMREQVQNIE